MKLAPFGIVGQEVIKNPFEAAKHYLELEGRYNEVTGDELFRLLKENGLNEDFFHKFMIELTKLKIKQTFSKDKLIVQAVDLLDSVTKSLNLIFERLVEFYGMYNPELVYKIDLDKFVKIKNLEERADDSMGYDLDEFDLETIKENFEMLKKLYAQKESIEEYIGEVMEEVAPNLTKLATPIIGAKLINIAGSLKRLAELPSSTIQVLGAEKALFRHLRSGAKPPKYGVILAHPLVQKSKDKGKIARMLAAKISIAVRVDYFGNSEFIADKLLSELEAKI